MYLPEHTIVASGAVILDNDNVLLVKQIKKNGISLWMFPGGKVHDIHETFEETCIREAKEELGIDIEISRPLATLLVERPDDTGYAFLIHFLATTDSEITPASNISEWKWIDIHALPDDCAPNVQEVIYQYLEEPK